jgi:glycine betaine/choline ABC-type transport system substrate-binding protein
MFPGVNIMCQNTNASIIAAGQSNKIATRSELLMFFWGSCLGFKYEFCNRSDLWSTRLKSKYKMKHQFGSLTDIKEEDRTTSNIIKDSCPINQLNKAT